MPYALGCAVPYVFVFFFPQLLPRSALQTSSPLFHSFIGGETFVFPPMSIREISVVVLFSRLSIIVANSVNRKSVPFFLFRCYLSVVKFRWLNVIIFTEQSCWLRMGVPKKRANLRGKTLKKEKNSWKERKNKRRVDKPPPPLYSPVCRR